MFQHVLFYTVVGQVCCDGVSDSMCCSTQLLGKCVGMCLSACVVQHSHWYYSV